MKLNELEDFIVINGIVYVEDFIVIDGIEYVKKRGPLSDEELKNLYDRHAFAMESDEYMWGFRDAEKAHGIGVDDE